MNRFGAKKEKTPLPRRIFASAALFCCGIFLLLQSAGSIKKNTSDSQAESLRRAIIRSAVSCYASEGMYPESLSYIKEHYGINWNEEKYVVDYEIIGSNLMPAVTVIPLK